MKEYFKISEVFTYFFRKKDPNRKSDFYLKTMHGINKISILVFLGAILFFILKKIF